MASRASSPIRQNLAAAGDDGGVVALLVGHGVDDGLDAGELGLVDVGGLLHAGKGTDRSAGSELMYCAGVLSSMAISWARHLRDEVYQQSAEAPSLFFCAKYREN